MSEFAEVLRPWVLLAVGLWLGWLAGRAHARRTRRNRRLTRWPSPACDRFPPSKPGVTV